jgi:hypothetical protein
MNYQYRYGTTTTQATLTLYDDGGWKRYYRGLSAALIQGPASRFGDTAANVGILALLQSNPYMRSLPTLFKSVFASLAAAGFRMILTPIDTVKTTLQTQGNSGMRILKTRVVPFTLLLTIRYLIFWSSLRLGSTALERCGTGHLLPQPQLSLAIIR